MIREHIFFSYEIYKNKKAPLQQQQKTSTLWTLFTEDAANTLTSG